MVSAEEAKAVTDHKTIAVTTIPVVLALRFFLLFQLSLVHLLDTVLQFVPNLFIHCLLLNFHYVIHIYLPCLLIEAAGIFCFLFILLIFYLLVIILKLDDAAPSVL